MFAHSIVRASACFQNDLPLFVRPRRVEVQARKVVRTCLDCAPRKSIHYETCE